MNIIELGVDGKGFFFKNKYTQNCHLIYILIFFIYKNKNNEIYKNHNNRIS